MANDHLHNWYVIKTRDIPDDPDVTLTVEQCSWYGEQREYRDTGHYDRG